MLEVEKILDVAPQYSIQQLALTVPSEKFNVVLLGDSTDNSAQMLLGLQKSSTILSYDESAAKKKNVFKVWE